VTRQAQTALIPSRLSEPLEVALVGAGLMGSQIGCEYLLGGHSVSFLVRDVEGSRKRVAEAFSVAVEAGIASPDAAAEAAGRLSFVESIDALDATTALVVESIPEDIELKRVVLGEVALKLPGAILASNTSSIPLTDLGSAIGAPERTIGTHYWNPPLLMPPVEIIAGCETRPAIVDRVSAIVEALGKEALLVERDVPGFIWNRLQAALLREVLWLVENGVASPRTIDRIVKSGLARRSRYTGPFETIALGGVHSWTRLSENLFPQLSTATGAGDLERWLDRSPEELAEARARRDRGLAEEIARSREQSV
jgi:3-hydroxybutyryl-CoA dehydrogenase